MRARKKFKKMKNCGLKSDHYDEKYMKIKFNSDNELTLDKTIKNPYPDNCC